jgi:hypothetical protein
MREDSQDGIQDRVQLLDQILRQEAKNEEPVLLQERILLSIPTVGLGIRQVLRAVQFDHRSGVNAQEVDLHLAQVVEGNGQFYIQLESPRSFRQGF